MRFFDAFFEEIDRRGIKTIVHLGDLVHRSRYAAFTSLNVLRRAFVQPILDRNLHLVIIPGNHDIPYKNSLRINASEELLPPHARIQVIDRPRLWNIHEHHVLMLPWICADNREESLHHIRTSPARLVFSHLELTGFQIRRGRTVDNLSLLGASSFSRFETVMSGHYHHRHGAGNIYYMGCPYQMDWDDHGDIKGWHVLDLDSGILEFVANPEETFVKLFYSDGPEYELSDDLSTKYVRLIVRDRGEDVVKFERVMKELESVAGHLEVQDDHRYSYKVDAREIMSEVSDTRDLLLERADALETSVDKDRLKTLLMNLYRKAESSA